MLLSRLGRRWLSSPPSSSSSTATEALLLRQPDATHPHVHVWTLNRPSARNGLSLPMLQALKHALDEVGHDQSVRAVILRAKGPAFCAGHDLKEIYSIPELERRAKYTELFDLCSQVMLQFRHLPQPVIAQVDGIATAAGCQLVTACDLVYATPSSTFATPGVNVGLFCSTPAVPLIRAVQRKHAMEMLLLGDPISAARAYEIGLINRVVPKEEIEATVLGIAVQIASKSTATIRLGKRVLNAQSNSASEEAAYAIASQGMVENLLYKQDAREGIAAFIQKRAAQWSHL